VQRRFSGGGNLLWKFWGGNGFDFVTFTPNGTASTSAPARSGRPPFAFAKSLFCLRFTRPLLCCYENCYDFAGEIETFVCGCGETLKNMLDLLSQSSKKPMKIMQLSLDWI